MFCPSVKFYIYKAQNEHILFIKYILIFHFINLLCTAFTIELSYESILKYLVQFLMDTNLIEIKCITLLPAL